MLNAGFVLYNGIVIDISGYVGFEGMPGHKGPPGTTVMGPPGRVGERGPDGLPGKIGGFFLLQVIQIITC